MLIIIIFYLYIVRCTLQIAINNVNGILIQFCGKWYTQKKKTTTNKQTKENQTNKQEQGGKLKQEKHRSKQGGI